MHINKLDAIQKMKHFTYILLISFIGALLFSFTQKDKHTIIYWNEDRLLTWDDFQGKKKELTKLRKSQKNKNTLAVCDSRIEFNLAKNDINAVFHKKTSLKAPIERLNEALLSHEQYHFNITELYVRKFKAFIHNKKDSIQHETYFNILNEFQKDHQEFQKKYDSETQHSNDIQAQLSYELKIDSLLNYLNEFRPK
jgi:thymidylate synthase